MLNYIFLICLSFISNPNFTFEDSLLEKRQFTQALERYSWELAIDSSAQKNIDSYLKASYACLELGYFDSGILFLQDLDKNKSESFNPIQREIYVKLKVWQLTQIDPNNSLIQIARNQSVLGSDSIFTQLMYTLAFEKNKNFPRMLDHAQVVNPTITDTYPEKSESIAKISSTILPGSGQIYAGKYKWGIGALALNALGGYLTLKAVVEERPISAGFIFSLLWYRYYTGNIEAAQLAVKEFNQNSEKTFRNKTVHQLKTIWDSELEKLRILILSTSKNSTE